MISKKKHANVDNKSHIKYNAYVDKCMFWEEINMSFVYKGKEYKSKKFPMLEYIFNEKTKNGTVGIGNNISFTLKDVSDGYKACGIAEPASISNTILDLTRQDRGIESRLPAYIIKFGYDLKKKTGPSPAGNYCGEFVHVGVGNTIHSWLVWDKSKEIVIKVKNTVPANVLKYISNDEGALFSAMDYCDLLSYALVGKPNAIMRVQNPMKWQPNEIDGLYMSSDGKIIYPVEAKAVSTGDDINLEQMLGQYKTITAKMPGVTIVPIAARMKPYGVDLALLKYNVYELLPTKFVKVLIEPEISSWKNK